MHNHFMLRKNWHQHACKAWILVLALMFDPPAYAKNPVSLNLTNPSTAEYNILRPYMIGLRQRIQSNCGIDADARNVYEAKARLIIGINGDLVNSAILETSGNDRFDSAITEAIQSSRPFPPLPVNHMLVIVATFSGSEPATNIQQEQHHPTIQQKPYDDSPDSSGKETYRQEKPHTTTIEQEQWIKFQKKIFPPTDERIKSTDHDPGAILGVSAKPLQRVVPTKPPSSRKSISTKSSLIHIRNRRRATSPTTTSRPNGNSVSSTKSILSAKSTSKSKVRDPQAPPVMTLPPVLDLPRSPQ